jgi:hypothetical protein
MNLTYAELAKQIDEMTDEQKASTATIFVPGIDEFYPIAAVEFTKEGGAADGILDKGHPVLVIANED